MTDELRLFDMQPEKPAFDALVSPLCHACRCPLSGWTWLVALPGDGIVEVHPACAHHEPYASCRKQQRTSKR